jgi:DNA-binding protein
MSKASNEIFIGKKPLMAYVTATLVQLANEDKVMVKARGNSITMAVDVAQIIEKRMESMGYKVGETKIGSEQLQSQDGRTRNVSTIEIEILKGQGSPNSSDEKKNSSSQGRKGRKKE